MLRHYIPLFCHSCLPLAYLKAYLIYIPGPETTPWQLSGISDTRRIIGGLHLFIILVLNIFIPLKHGELPS